MEETLCSEVGSAITTFNVKVYSLLVSLSVHVQLSHINILQASNLNKSHRILLSEPIPIVNIQSLYSKRSGSPLGWDTNIIVVA